MAKRKITKKENPKTKSLPTEKRGSSLKSRISSGSEKITLKLNQLKKKRYFPYLFIVLVLLSITYFGRKLLFAAFVDGKPISRIKLINELEKSAGQTTLDNLITKELILSEAKRKGITVSSSDINTEIQRIEEMLKAQGTTLDAALLMQGQNRDSLNENIKLQKTVEKLLADSIQVSDEEVQKYFDDNKQMYGTDVKFEDIKDSITEQISQEKLSSQFQVLIENLRKEGNIKYILNFK